MAEERRETLRRRGVGGTLPVGWKHMSPPNEEVRHKILQQIMERVKKEEQASAERAARAEERKNEKEKSAWHRQQIEDCNKKIESVNCRKTELDDLKSRLFAELKEVVAKDKAQKATSSQLSIISQAKGRHDTASGDNSATSVTTSSSLSGHMQAQQMGHLHDGVTLAHDSFRAKLNKALTVCKQFKMCGNAPRTSEEPYINGDCDENVASVLSQYIPPDTERASVLTIASTQENHLPLSKKETHEEFDDRGNGTGCRTYRILFVSSPKESRHASPYCADDTKNDVEVNFIFKQWNVPVAIFSS
uniref:Uncharacterized protein n=1 Tax=Parascaris univalens TaxID=6257 RepID=A0A915BC18_PARUN